MSVNPLAAHPPWRQIVVAAVALPLVVVAAILAFAFPAARTDARDLPLGVVGDGPTATRVTSTLTRAQPGAFDLHLYATEGAARTAIEHRDVYGAVVVGARDVTMLTASGASPTVATQLDAVAQALPGRARIVDVVPTASGDPRGTVLGAAVLPLCMCGVLIAAAVGLLLRFRSAWRQLAAITTIVATAALGAYLITQGFLGALPGNGFAVWGSLMLILGAIAGAVTGLYALVGNAGLGAGAATMIFVGNAFSGATSAPELLPSAIGHIGQWLPPGAGVGLLRDAAYFHGHGAAPHVTVLAVWIVLGFAAVLVGNRSGRAAAQTDGPAPDAVEHGRHERDEATERLARESELVGAGSAAAGRHEQAS